MLVDYHIHTKMCGHATGEMDEYVRRAKELGLAEIGFSDHIPMYFLPEGKRNSTIAMSEKELPAYVATVLNLQKKYYPFSIKLGIEADFEQPYLTELDRLLNSFPFDYILGSIHFLEGWGFDNPEFIGEYKYRDIDEIYLHYYGLLEEAIKSKRFDVIAHPDLIKKLAFYPTKDLAYLYDRLAKLIGETGVCIEVNTAGLRVPAKEIYPAPYFLKACYNNGVPVTLGSDAHCPELVGAGFPEALKLLRNIGYNQLTLFNQRKSSRISF